MYAYNMMHSFAGLFMGEAGISLQLCMTRSSGLPLLVLRTRPVKVKSHFNYSLATLRYDLHHYQ